MKKYDVFISYAIEDKHPVASGIAEKLRDSGLKVYFVGEKLDPGDLISDTVNTGLEQSKFCVLILSNNYVRHWPAIERNHILHREKKAGKKLVFPVWNRITKDQVSSSFPELADHYAPTMDDGLNNVVEDLVLAIRKRKQEDTLRYWRNFALIMSLSAAALIGLYKATENTKGTPPFIHNTQPVSPDN